MDSRIRRPSLLPIGSQFGVDNRVLHGRGSKYKLVDFEGPLSSKTAARGAVGWNVPTPIDTARIFLLMELAESIVLSYG